jgi:hypothetical protein
MADKNTHLRELSVGVYLVTNYTNLFPENVTPLIFLQECQKIKNAESIKLDQIASGNSFNSEERNILKNGKALAEKLQTVLKTKPDDIVTWEANNHSEPHVDIVIGIHKISLKEKSKILANMGLYQFQNILTNSTDTKPIHVFEYYSPIEFSKWFEKTFALIVNLLKLNNNCLSVSNARGTRTGVVKLNKDKLILELNIGSDFLTCNLEVNTKYVDFINIDSRFKEFIFAKIIEKHISKIEPYKSQYNEIKKKCCKIAGIEFEEKFKEYVGTTSPLYGRLIGLKDATYIYAKVVDENPEVYQVPSINDYPVKLLSLKHAVPKSQLRIVSHLEMNGRTFQVHSELRYKHGQFYGVPESTLYIDNVNKLKDIWTKLD